MTPDHRQDAPLGVAVVGHSFMGRAHSNAWRNVAAFYPDAPAVRRRVLVGRDAARVADSAAQLGWEEAATDWRAVLDRRDVDVVDVCTPGHLHAEVAVAALEAGKHVIVEKPLANTVAEAERMLAAARRARTDGVRAMVGFNYRRVPALALARELVREGRLGTVRQVRVSYLQDWLVDPGAPMTWRLRRERAGSGALGDLGSHAVDQVHALLGEPVIEAQGRLQTFVTERDGESGPEPVTVDDAAWATLRTRSGTVVSLEVSRMATGRKNALQVEVYGSAGSLGFDLESLNELRLLTAEGEQRLQGPRRVLVTEADHPYLDAWWPPGHILGWDHTFTSQAADFLRAIARGQDPAPGFEEGYAVQQVLDGIARSADAGGAAVSVTTTAPTKE
ncbi:Gfo/Idh/MocA family protein [Ornithinicoccus halotolerans]|uniref:Gfo/Idh/MocA family protein n=1 Tax=Ornithinicoccus halotolerans TaxID=1748220 RepID=UPI001294D313|nr:Gfo/Idh/MocA family oxidoreductase [Ornithinicoccus halotolerans]